MVLYLEKNLWNVGVGASTSAGPSSTQRFTGNDFRNWGDADSLAIDGYSFYEDDLLLEELQESMQDRE